MIAPMVTYNIEHWRKMEFCAALPPQLPQSSRITTSSTTSQPSDRWIWRTVRLGAIHFEIALNNPRTDSYISGTISSGRQWEPDIVQVILKRARGSKHVFVDAGANIGYFSAIAAAAGAQVYSFEAVPSNFARLSATRARLHTEKWYAWNGALDARAGDTVVLQVAHAKSNSGNFKIRAHLKAAYDGHVAVTTTTLDEHVHTHVDVMKIDVEGHEARVLSGAHVLICHHGVQTIIMEMTQDLMTFPGCDWRAMFSWLEAVGYTLRDMSHAHMPIRHWRRTGWRPRAANIMWDLGAAGVNCASV